MKTPLPAASLFALAAIVGCGPGKSAAVRPAADPASRRLGAIVLKRFRIPATSARPHGIALGPDGAMWFTEGHANAIGRLTTTAPHVFEEFPLPHPNSEPWGIAAGPDGKMWFTEAEGNRVGSIATTAPHEIFEIDVPATKPWARPIAAGPGGAVWFAELAGFRLGRVTVGATPEIRDFPLPRYPNSPESVAAGPDGNVWFGTHRATIARALGIFPEAMVEYPFQTGRGTASTVVAASDGNLWFGRNETSTFGRILTEEPHTITELRLPARGSPAGMCATPGFVWLVLDPGRSLYRVEVAPPHRMREIPLPAAMGQVVGLAAAPDGNVWLIAPDANAVEQLLVGTLLRGAAASVDDRLSVPAPLAGEYVPAPATAAEGELDIGTDRDATISIDGVEQFRMKARDGKVIPIAAGRHRVTGVAALDGARCEREVEVFSGIRAHVQLERYGEKPFEPLPPARSGDFVPTDPHIAFVSISPGEFTMGSETGKPDERPAHRVRITKPFEIGRYELTQKEWAVVMGPIPQFDEQDPSKRPWIRYADQAEDKPVTGISWYDAEEIARRLTTLDGRRRYRLPTEAEWEYVCRAGTGEDIPAGLEEYAWVRSEYIVELHPVGKKRPNAWGLHDMHGNAGEWVSDWYDKDFYRHSPPSDPAGPPSGYQRMHRGGDAANLASGLGCVTRSGIAVPVGRDQHVGVRLVRELGSGP